MCICNGRQICRLLCPLLKIVVGYVPVVIACLTVKVHTDENVACVIGYVTEQI